MPRLLFESLIICKSFCARHINYLIPGTHKQFFLKIGRIFGTETGEMVQKTILVVFIGFFKKLLYLTTFL